VTPNDLDALNALGHPVRRRLYDVVVDSGRAVTRDHAAASAGVSRSLAAYHLDKLVAEGLLEATFEREAGRGGPGAGRPAKRYRRAAREFVLRAPPRDYRLLSELLVRAADEAKLRRMAYEYGREAGAAAKGNTLAGVLRDRGYEPFEDVPGTLRLRNCPFEGVAARYPDVVCGLNLELVNGIVDGLETHSAQAMLEPRDGVCCVAIKTR
jgi:predicted ArsR family transcriptional regulator